MSDNLKTNFKRVWRHVATTTAVAKRAFPPPTLDAITAAVMTGEQTHRGEIRLVVEKSLPLAAVWAGVSNRQRALAMFAECGVWDTADNCGVLIYVNLAERRVDIVADRGIDRCIDAATWQAVCNTMTAGFAQGNFHDSTLAAIARVNDLLRTHFPATDRRPNELPDRPAML
ncbi:TPM domain-containing protein [Massilia sp. S19_KUP03_FR1]|uniref:TPM domain-containing protein n=1 Tax=Massilia sp. S19_KUP03_FR1 TaxID=3025503 RepID=UPI002FCCB8D6